MFITRTERKFVKLNLDDSRDIAELERLMNDPQVNILERRREKQSESTYEGDVQTVTETTYLHVEYEVCSL